MEKHEITYIPVDQLYEHPDNPRKELGDLTELTESIKLNGVMQNLTVVPGHRVTDADIDAINEEYVRTHDATVLERYHEWMTDGYTIIIGHRRAAAAKLAGLAEVPCVVSEMDYKTQIETMLTENMQRADLTIWEQAQGFQMMLDLGSTETQIAERTGFSKATVRKRVKIAGLGIGKESFEQAEARGGTLDDFVRLEQINDDEVRQDLAEHIGTRDFEFLLNRQLREQKEHLVLDRIIPVLQKFAKEIKPYQTYDSSKYRQLESYDLNSDDDVTVQTPQDDDKREFAYCRFSGYVGLYEVIPVEKPSKEDEEETQRRAAEFQEAKHALETLHADAYASRMAFITNLETHVSMPVSRDVREKLLAAYERYGNSGYSTYTGCDKNIIADCMKNHALEFVGLILPYMHMKADPRYRRNYNNQLHYVKSNELDAEYEYIQALGYVPSEEEQQMLDGTHPKYLKEAE